MYLIQDMSLIFIWISVLSTIQCAKSQKGRKRDMMEDIQKTVNLIWTAVEKNEQKMSSNDNTILLMSNRVEKIIDSIEHNKLNNKLLDDKLERLELKIRNIDDSMNDKINTISDSVDQITHEVKRIDTETDSKLRKIMNIMSETYELSKDVSILMKGRSTSYGTAIGNGDNDGPEPLEELQKKVLEQLSVVETSISQQVSNVGKISKQTLTALDTINLEMINLRDEIQSDKQTSQQTDKRDSGSYYPSVKSDVHQCSNLNVSELKQEIESQFERIDVKLENEMTVIESKITEFMTSCNTNTNTNGRSTEGTAPLIVNSSQMTSFSPNVAQSSVYVPIRKSIGLAERPTGKDGCKQSQLMAPRDCTELMKSGANCDGVYIIHIQNIRLLRVYCDMTDNAGGWTVILRRGDFGKSRHRISFEQDWNAYRDGFGNIESGEFWLGLDNIYHLTTKRDHMLQVDLESFDGDYVSIIYDSFKIGTEDDNYRLHLGNAINSNGTVAQSLLAHNSSMFSTYDRNNNVISKKDNCADKLKGGWWFHNCHSALLTAPYFTKHSRKHVWQGIQWHSWKQMNHLKAAQMKIKAKE